MTKYLIIKQGLSIGGTETLAVGICNLLANNSFDATLLTEDRQGKVEISGKIRKLIYKVSIISLLVRKISEQFVNGYELEIRLKLI